MEDTAQLLTILLLSILAFPFAFMILYWIKIRKDRLRNEEGQVEYKSVGNALIFFLVEGLALVGCISILTIAMSGILRYVVHVYN